MLLEHRGVCSLTTKEEEIGNGKKQVVLIQNEDNAGEFIEAEEEGVDPDDPGSLMLRIVDRQQSHSVNVEEPLVQEESCGLGQDEFVKVEFDIGSYL